MWQRYRDARGRDFRMLAVAQDVQGAERVAPVVESMGVEVPVLLDTRSQLARELSFRIVPAGALVDEQGALVHRQEDFAIGDPRVRANVDAFLDGRRVRAPARDERMDPAALELFARGVEAHADGSPERALELWRRALELDPDNFLIRSQIWTVEHPDRFWPVVDRDWQELRLLEEGYEGPLP